MLRTLLAPRLAVVLLLLLLLGLPLSDAAQVPLVHLSPALVLVPVGGTSCVDLRVENVENLFAFATVIRFDPSRLAVVDALPGSFLQPTDPNNWYVVKSVDNAGGSIHLAITLFAPERGRSGSGVLATACFQGINRGHSPIAFTDTETLLLDPHVSIIPFATKSGGAFIGPVYRFRIPLVVRGN